MAHRLLKAAFGDQARNLPTYFLTRAVANATKEGRMRFLKAFMGIAGIGLMVTLALVVVFAATAGAGQSLSGKKVLFVNSYHEGYEWSDGEQNGALSVLKASGVEMKPHYMDTKRNPAESFLKEAGMKVKAAIETYKPDVVIVADDNGTKIMIQYYKDTSLPWVFTGVNWDAKPYGLPFKNATGVEEVALVKELIANLKTYAKGNRVGFLTVDSETERTEQRAYRDILKIQFAQEKFVKTLADWKENFKRMQGEVDILYLGNYAGINDWKWDEAAAWALEHTKIPSGSTYDYMMPISMLGMTKIPEEQGILAAKMALQILQGTPAGTIPIAQNKQAKLYLNVKLGTKAGIVFKPELVKNAEVIK